jgi:flavin-dependent dehydrogenase
MALMADQVDVFVVGAGPAGLAAAIAARQKGFRVTVADGAAPPVDKACGEGLMPESHAWLRALGVGILPGEGFRFRGIRFVQEGASASADFSRGFGIGLRRPLLHQKLTERAVKCGVELLWKAPVTGIDERGVWLGGRKIRARWIVGADGQSSRVRRWSGLEPSGGASRRFASRRHYGLPPWSEFMEICWNRRTQAYITPVSSGEICVVLIGESPEDVAFERALRQLPELQDRLRPAELASRERGAVTVSRSLRNVQRGNVALVGDASGSVDAITGEGLRLAFRQAFALADAMEAGNLESYQREHRSLERRPMMMGRWMMLLGRQPALRSRVVESFARKPELFRKLLAFHTGEGHPAGLLSAGVALGWRLLAA